MNNDSRPPAALMSTDVTRNTFTINSGLLRTKPLVPIVSALEGFHCKPQSMLIFLVAHNATMYVQLKFAEGLYIHCFKPY